MDDNKPLLIGDRWVTDTGAALESINPATGQKNYTVCAATAREVDDAVAVARQAADARSWRQMLPHVRARLLSRLAEVIESRADVFAHTQMRENGKVLRECRAQATAAAAIFRYYAAVCETVSDSVTPARGNYFSMALHEPYGVVAAITPWNSPLTMEAQKVAPAIAAGNAVILKPSEITPSPALELGKAALDAGLPAGILNVLPGTGAVAGNALVLHPGVRFVSFTGGTESGRRIAGAAAEKLMPVALELGGKSPHIVFADADIDAAVAAVAEGIFEASGQSCVAGSRLLVHRSVYDRVLAGVVEHAQSLKIDLPDAPGAQLGPISSFTHRDRVAGFVDAARAEGGEVVTGGGQPPFEKLLAGAYYMPTVVAGLSNKASVCQQEIFGPVLCVLPFDDEDDLVTQANESAYGLAAGVWTADYQRAWRVAGRLEAGTVWINTYKQLSISTPFGGFKDSGMGREKGVGGMRLYQQEKGLYFGLGATGSAP
ncbi:MAG TPA: aldehyde dehydrogenase family protein [Burkholderiales bacterium]|nr:aldehyde dehydrogenase family protein [Burkholderiales bacterium]